MKLFLSQDDVSKKILKELNRCAKNKAKFNHTLISGGPGTGKSTILRYLEEAIRNKPKLDSYFKIVVLPTFFNDEKIVDNLEETFGKLGPTALKKNIILIIDDLDLLLMDSKTGASRLRGVLLDEHPKVSLLGTSRPSFKDELGHQNSFYGMFKIEEIKELKSDDVLDLLNPILETPTWHYINRELSLTNSFWLLNIAGLNPRLLTIIKNIVLSMEYGLPKNRKKVDLDPGDFIIRYYELAGPIFLNEVMEIPRKARYLLESAALLDNEFTLKSVDLQAKNPSQEAQKLVSKDIIKKGERGTYSIKRNYLKSWIRYMKNLPLGYVLNSEQKATLHN